MAQSTSRFTELSRAATIVSLVVSAGFVLIGMITGLPWYIGIFGFLFLAALADALGYDAKYLRPIPPISVIASAVVLR